MDGKGNAQMFTKETPRRAQTQKNRLFVGMQGAGKWKNLGGWVLRAGLGAMLTRGTLPGGCRPFGLGYAAASGTGWNGLAALCGVLFSLLWGKPGGTEFRCAAAAALLYAVNFACWDLRVYESEWFLPLCCVVTCGLTGLIYGSSAGWSRASLLVYGWEVILSGVSCVFFRLLEKKRPAGMLWLGLGLTVFAGSLSPTAGSAVAAFLTLLAARGGSGRGGVTGGLLGLGAGLVTGGDPSLSGILCCCGALCGALCTVSRLAMVTAFPLCGVLLGTWCGMDQPIALPCLVALVVSALPEGLLRRLQDDWGLSVRPVLPVSPASAEAVRYHLEEQATAFRTLYEHIHDSVEQGEPLEPASALMDRTTERLCKGCARQELCWKQDRLSTTRAMNQALAAMLERGSVEPGDFGPFRRQCLRREELVRISNEELYRFWNRRRYRARMKNNRLAVCRQYDQLSGLLTSAADSLGEPITTNHAAASRAESAAAQMGCAARCMVWVDSRGRHTLELRGKNLEKMNNDKGTAALSEALNVTIEPCDVFRTPRGQRLIFRQTPPLSARVAVASRQKAQGEANGDNGIWFRDGSGILWAILCDGMGSGNEAANDSRLLMTLLKDFLHAGIEPNAALTTLTGAMSLRGEVDGGFTTVDLLKIDLFNGSASLHKLGSAPSYLRKNGSVSRVTGTSLPAGLETDRETTPDTVRFTLSNGDLLLLVTDGVTDGTGDGWLRTMLGQYPGDSPRELAQAVLSHPNAGREDDRTVVAVRVGKRV